MPTPADIAFPTKGEMRKMLNEFLRHAKNRSDDWAIAVSAHPDVSEEDANEINDAVILALRAGKIRVGWRAKFGMMPVMANEWKHEGASVYLHFRHHDWGMFAKREDGISALRLRVHILTPMVRNEIGDPLPPARA